MQPDKETIKEKNRTKTASSGSSRNSSSPCFSDQSGDTEKVDSSSDYDDEKEEENSHHSTPGAKQQSCLHLVQDLQKNNDSDIQTVMTSTPTKHGDSGKQTGMFF